MSFCVFFFFLPVIEVEWVSLLSGATPAFLFLPAFFPLIMLLASLTSSVFPCSGSSWALTRMSTNYPPFFPVSFISLISMGGLLITLRFCTVLVQAALKLSWPHLERLLLQRHLLWWPPCLPHITLPWFYYNRNITSPTSFLGFTIYVIQRRKFWPCPNLMGDQFQARDMGLFLGLLKRFFPLWSCIWTWENEALMLLWGT